VLRGMKFKDLFTTSKGREVARRLVTALIEQQIGQELGVGRTSCVELIELD
jgi:nuclear pore complex protein Nup155